MRESSKNKEEKKAQGNGKSSAISGLSSSTQALLKKALDAKKPATPQQKSSQSLKNLTLQQSAKPGSTTSSKAN